jgi:hypothetical protein
MTGFVQVIELRTSRIEEIQAMLDKRRAAMQAEGADTAPLRAVLTADRDREGYYLTILEFESYERAMENSRRPDTGEFAARMAELCDEPPRFLNLDVLASWTA